MNTKKLQLSSVILIVLLFASCRQGNMADYIKPSNLFSDNMVLQREKPVSVWGKATPNSTIEVRFNKQHKTIHSKPDSTWQVDLKPEKAGGPYQLVIIGKDTIVYKNVMVGEVWVCSGQSNMEMPLAAWGEINNYKQEIADARYPDIRLRTIDQVASLLPQTTTTFSSWEECSPATIENFSATAYFFGRKLYNELHIPIGLIHASVGGTPVEAWTPVEFISKVSSIKPIVPYDERTPENAKKLESEYQKKTATWNKNFEARLEQVEKDLPDMTSVNLDDSRWNVIRLPRPWEDAEVGLEDFDGVVWFRKTFQLTAKDLKNERYEISLGLIHDANRTYINGIFIGESETRWGSSVTTYAVPKRILKVGENTIAVRIINYAWIGGICGDKDNLWLKNNNGLKIDLAGDWKCKMIFNLADFPEFPVSPSNDNEPAVLYNGMINPLIPGTIRGVIWYQGEANADRPIQYRKLFPLLIESWRAKWNLGDFPFYYVQLANFMERKKEPQKSNWAMLREAQNMALSLPNTGEAVAIDIGDANDIHPKNKQEVGRRLALIALNKTYGKNVVYSGPMYDSKEIHGDTVVLNFTHTGSGLIASNGSQLKGFAISGSDKQFKWAKAKIKGNKVLVWNDRIRHPVAVRYGWADNPDCNLYNKEGLPASPFRTDKWDDE